jgi:hypothetical protein
VERDRLLLAAIWSSPLRTTDGLVVRYQTDLDIPWSNSCFRPILLKNSKWQGRFGDRPVLMKDWRYAMARGASDVTPTMGGAMEPRGYCGQNKTRRPWIGRRVRLLSSASPLIVLRNRYYFFIFSSSMHFFCASPVKFLHFSGTCPKAAAELSAKRASTRETSNFFMGTSS